MTQYDEIGAAYEKVKEVPLVQFAERPNVLRALKNVQGKRVLDLACGTGYYTRIIRQLGATEVVGVDISGEMIKRAIEIETGSPLGITYQIMDATELPALGRFDWVNAIYLLNYAPNEEVLKKMLKSVHQNLAPGGEFFAWTDNPDFSFDGANNTKYGATITPLRRFDEGWEEHWEVHCDPPISFTTYRFTREVYERAIFAAGFREFSWAPMVLSDDVIAQFPTGHWDDLLANPSLIGLSAR